jgi:hypothetical protein
VILEASDATVKAVSSGGSSRRFLFRLLKPDGVLREIFRNLKIIGSGALLACNTIYGVPIVSPSQLAVVNDQGVNLLLIVNR